MGKVTESLDSTAVLVDPHALSPESSWYCVRGAGQLTEVFLMSMWATLMTPLTPHLSASM